jgi:hypothetical protein
MSRSIFAVLFALAIAACGDVTGPNQNGNADADVSMSTDGGAGGGGDATDAPDANPACVNCSPFASCPVDMCVCNQGFTGDGEVCSDVNECLTNNGGCDTNATCMNESGGFSCTCAAGYFGDGFDCTQRWAQVNTDANRNLGFWNYTTSHNGSIYYADSGTFFRAYDVATGNTTNHAVAEGFCGCGYTATPFSAAGYIYSFGSDGERYAGQWQTVSYPERRGEAGFALYNGLVYRVGGRNSNGDQAHLHTFDPVNLSWSATGAYADYPWISSFVGLAGWGGQIYGFAGDTPAGDDKVAVYNIANNTWTALTDAPFGAYRPHVVVHENYIFILAGTVVYVFDPATETWSNNAFGIPFNMTNAKIVLANDELYVIGDVGANIQVFRLNGYEF